MRQLTRTRWHSMYVVLLLAMLAALLAGCGNQDPDYPTFGPDWPTPGMPHNSAYDTVVGYPGQGFNMTPQPRPRHGLVLGHITNQSGEPLDEVYVDAEWLGPRIDGIDDVAVYSNTEGMYIWELPPGRFRLTFKRLGYETATRDVDIHEQDIITLDLQLEDPK
jgi:hypothetical protein